MDNIIWPEYLYTFLGFTEKSSLDKKVLDCGAGGIRPPLALFSQRGYQTYGIDISEKAINASKKFAFENDFVPQLKYKGPLYLTGAQIDTEKINESVMEKLEYIQVLADGSNSCLDIALELKIDFFSIMDLFLMLEQKGLIEKKNREL